MRTLVCGGAGFIGNHLCKKLVKRGDEVIVYDNLITGNKDNLKGIEVEFEEYDISDFIVHDEVDLIFNLASPASPVMYQKYPFDTLMANSKGMSNVLEYARDVNVRVIQASTSEVYGDPLVHPQKETYWGNVNPNGIRSMYDEGKRFAEALCMTYHRESNVNVVIARIFNTYGPNMRHDDGRAVPNFIYQALRNKSITVYGTGNQTRSFCYVDDLVDGLIALSEKGKSGEVYNVGNPEEHTMNGLASMIKTMCWSKSRIIHKKLPQDDPTRRCPDITKITKATGWKPKVDLGNGLDKTIKWFEEEMK